MSLLSARDLSVAPPAEASQGSPPPVVRGFSLELERGQWVAVSGANGCGKTSLLLALAGLWPARSGVVLFEGEPLGPASPRERRRGIAVILQDPSCQLLQPTVREELSFSAVNLGRAEQDVAHDVESWSARLGLTGELERDPQQLSAGRQQLVLLAAALVTRPALLLADEPAAHLDAATRRLVLGVVREEVERGLSAVWVTQDVREKSAADRVVELSDSPRVHPGTASLSPDESAAPLLTLEVAPWDGHDGPRIAVASHLSIRVLRTGITAIRGPNGAGKSVLLSAATGLLRLGQVGIEPGGPFEPPPIMAMQYPELEIFEERVADEVVYAAASRGVDRAEAARQAREIFDRLGLSGDRFLGRRTWDLSGGEKRLLSLTGALIAPAALLALDEPTAGLDPPRRAALSGIIAESGSRRAVLIASQDLEWLSGLALRAFTLDELDARVTPSSSKKTD